MVPPSLLQATEVTGAECPRSVCNSWPVAIFQRSQTLIVLSQLPLARALPSLRHTNELTIPEWPSSVRSSRPVTASQSLIVLSFPPLARVLPSQLHATDQMVAVCPRRACNSRLVLTSQSLTVLSLLPL